MVLACLAVSAGVVRASPAGLLGAMPADADIAIVIDRGKLDELTPAVEAALQGLETSGVFPKTADAVRELGRLIKPVLEEGSFDGPVGVALTLGEAGSFDWAIYAEAPSRSERWIKRLFRPRPRERRGDLPVLAFDKGRAWISFARAPQRGQDERGGDRVAMVVGPSGGPLFERLVPLLRQGAADDNLASRDDHRAATRALDTRGVAAAASLRLGSLAPHLATKGDPVKPDPRMLLTVQAPEAERLKIQTLSDPGVVWATAGCCDRFTLWSPQTQPLVDSSTMLSMTLVGLNSSQLDERTSETLRSVPGLSRIALEVLPVLGERSRVALRRTAEEKFELVFTAEPSEAIDPERVSAVFDDRVAAMMDRIVLPMGLQAVPRFGGAIPNAVRSTPLTPTGSTKMAWRYERGWLLGRVGPVSEQGQRQDASAESEALEAAAARFFEGFEDAEAGGPPGDGRVVSAGHVKPRALARELLAGPSIGYAAVAALIESMTWRATLEGGFVRAQIGLELAAAAAEPAGGAAEERRADPE